VHNIPQVHDFFHSIPSIISELIMGLVIGFIAYLMVELVKRIRN